MVEHIPKNMSLGEVGRHYDLYLFTAIVRECILFTTSFQEENILDARIRHI